MGLCTRFCAAAGLEVEATTPTASAAPVAIAVNRIGRLLLDSTIAASFAGDGLKLTKANDFSIVQKEIGRI